jgi:hypothetical protein
LSSCAALTASSMWSGCTKHGCRESHHKTWCC